MGTTQKTKTPSNLSITRSGLTFTFEWKCTDNNYNDGQQLQYRTSAMATGKWHNVTIGASTRKKSVSLSASDYYPANKKPKLTTVSFRVRGKQKKVGDGRQNPTKSWSDWSDVKKYTLKEPSAPSISCSVSNNVATFTWSAPDGSKTPTVCYRDAVYQFATVTDFSGYDKVKAWTTVSGVGMSGVKAIVVDGAGITSKTAILRVKVRATSGDSEWRYTYHIFAIPSKPEIASSSTKLEMRTETRWLAKITWKQTVSIHRPVSSMDVEYLIDTPTGNACSPPSNPSYNTIGTVIRSGDVNKFEWYGDDTIGLDKCAWGRIISKHDDKTNPSEPCLMYASKLTPPAFDETNTRANGKQITVAVDYDPAVENAKVDVSLCIGNSKTYTKIGTLPVNNSWTSTFSCADTTGQSYRIKIQAVYGNYMKSNEVYLASGNMPKAPNSISASMITADSVRLSWNWPWTDANAATISWSTDENAWESTEEPETYDIDSKVTSWIVKGLEPDTKYYFKVRLRDTSGDDEVLSSWSASTEFTLSSDLLKPSIGVSNDAVNINSSIICTCSYSESENTSVEIREVINGSVANVYLSKSNSSVHTLKIADINNLYRRNNISQWTTGSTHSLVCRISKGNKVTDWSDPVIVSVIPSLSITSFTHSLEDYNVLDDDGETILKVMKALTSLPLNVAVSGAGVDGKTTISIIRADDFSPSRPDEMNQECFEGEIAYSIQVEGDADIDIDVNDLINQIDDGSLYYLVASITDKYGQEASQKFEFIAKWDHQPSIPVVTVLSDDTNLISKITVTEPEGVENGDTFDIYRLSADKPELIISDGTYGTTYVDPYPAFGENSGHRIVNKTKYGDYITSDGTLAWTDTINDENDFISSKYSVIDFDGKQIKLEYNIELQNSWSKDFKRTSYLGGSVVGDWNAAVTRDLKLTAVHIDVDDDDTLKNMRMLADYPGICHIRTQEGSSFACDIQVSESISHVSKNMVSFDLTISKINPEEFDGMTLEEWTELNT